MARASKQCEAIVEDFAHGTSYSGLRRPTTVPKRRPCTFAAKKKLGGLALCARHLALALDGFIAPTGAVTPRADRVNYQSGLVQGRPERWAKGFSPEELSDGR